MIERRVIKAEAKKQIRYNMGFLIAAIVLGETLGNLGLYETLIYQCGIELPYLVANSMDILGFLLGGVMIFGICRISLNTINREPASFRDLFSGFEIYLKVLAMYAVSNAFTAMGSMLFVIPGIIISIMFSQAFFILAEDDEKSIIKCLLESEKMMRGHKLEFLYLQLSFIGWIIVSILTLGIALFWVEPYTQMTMANYYLKLKEEYNKGNIDEKEESYIQ